VLRELGVPDAHNISMFLADRSLQHISAESLILIDEASMVTMPHLDQVLAQAIAAGSLADAESVGDTRRLARKDHLPRNARERFADRNPDSRRSKDHVVLFANGFLIRAEAGGLRRRRCAR
jgi:hypothetical protein